MFETVFQSLQEMSPVAVYMALLAMPFIENIFPPSPSDVIVVIGGTLIGAGIINFPAALLLSAFGSEAGFILLYYLGKQTDRKLLQAGKLKFINRETLQTAEDWFQKFGFAIILFNRFISGVRSVIAYFAGVSELPLKKTIILSSLSSLLWHGLLLGLGWYLGAKADMAVIDKYLSLYGDIMLVITAAVLLFLALRYFLRKKKSKGRGA